MDAWSPVSAPPLLRRMAGIVVRLVFVLAAVFGVGTPVLAYIIAWVVIPNAPVFYPQAYPAYQAPQQAESQPSQPQA
jgi:hypothetical protein